MQRVRHYLLAAAGVILVVGVITLLSRLPASGNGQGGGSAPARDVEVVNTAANPALVRNVDRPSPQRYMDFLNGIFADGDSGTGSVFFNPVPAGKRLVIEHISVSMDLPVGQKGFTVFQIGSYSCNLPMTLQGAIPPSIPQTDRLVASQEVRLYFNPGEVPGFHANRSDFAGRGFVQVNIFGYLEDL